MILIALIAGIVLGAIAANLIFSALIEPTLNAREDRRNRKLWDDHFRGNGGGPTR